MAVIAAQANHIALGHDSEGALLRIDNQHAALMPVDHQFDRIGHDRGGADHADVGAHHAADVLEVHVVLDAEIAHQIAFTGQAQHRSPGVGHGEVPYAAICHLVIGVQARGLGAHGQHGRLHQLHAVHGFEIGACVHGANNVALGDDAADCRAINHQD